MSWSQGQPTDNTKIRNLGFVIRPNWKAIEEAQPELRYWGSNYANRNTIPSMPGEDPTAIPDTYITYSKETVAGIPELWGINENSDKTQFTDGAATLNNSGGTFLAGGLRYQWDRKTENDNTIIIFPTAFSAPPYVVLVNMAVSSTAAVWWMWASTADYLAASFVVHIVNSSLQPATNAQQFQYMAIGPA